MATQLGEFLSRSQVARRLGISAERINQLARAGRIEFVETPLGRLYSVKVVEALERERAEVKEQERESATG